MSRKRKNYVDLTRDLIDLTNENSSEIDLPTLLEETVEMKAEPRTTIAQLKLPILNDEKLPEDAFILMILNLDPIDLLSLLRTNKNLAQRFKHVFETQLQERYPSLPLEERFCKFGTNDGHFCGVKDEVTYQNKKTDCLEFCKQSLEKWLIPFVDEVTKNDPMALHLRARDQKGKLQPQCDFNVDLFLRKFELSIRCGDLNLIVSFNRERKKWPVVTFAEAKQWTEEKKQAWGYNQGFRMVQKFSETFPTMHQALEMIVSFLKEVKFHCRIKLEFHATTSKEIADHPGDYKTEWISSGVGPCKDMTRYWWVRPRSNNISLQCDLSVSKVFRVFDREQQVMGLNYAFEMRVPSDLR